MRRRIVVTGGPGSGASTLGRALAAARACPHVDSDDLQWESTEPPFQRQRPLDERVRRLRDAIAGPEWVLSGSVVGWGGPERAWADLVVFLHAPNPVRMARIHARDRARFGAAIEAGGAMYDAHQRFLAWADGYERGDRPGRSLDRHERWLAACEIPVVRLDATRPLEDLLAALG